MLFDQYSMRSAGMAGYSNISDGVYGQQLGGWFNIMAQQSNAINRLGDIRACRPTRPRVVRLKLYVYGCDEQRRATMLEF
jgi:hypothetical protein